MGFIAKALFGAVCVAGATLYIAKRIEESTETGAIDFAIDTVGELGKGAMDVLSNMSESEDIKKFGEIAKSTTDIMTDVAKYANNHA
jgi:hypothetical protein